MFLPNPGGYIAEKLHPLTFESNTEPGASDVGVLYKQQNLGPNFCKELEKRLQQRTEDWAKWAVPIYDQATTTLTVRIQVALWDI